MEIEDTEWFLIRKDKDRFSDVRLSCCSQGNRLKPAPRKQVHQVLCLKEGVPAKSCMYLIISVWPRLG